MFNVKEFFQRPYNIDSVEINVGNETFLVRRLNGMERQVFNETQSILERSIYVIANCLIDGITNEKIGRANAELFIERYDALSNQLIEEILDLTSKSLEEEGKIWDKSVKNSKKTSSKSSKGNTVDDTGSIH